MTISPPQLRFAGEEDTTLLDRRRRKRRRRLVLRILIALLTLALIATGIWLVGFSSVLAVQQTQVSGTKTLTADEVRDVAAVPTGAPLARVDLAAVEQRVQGIRQIESVQIDRRWPDTVRIRIVERDALYVVPQGEQGLLVDRFGVGYLSVPITETAGLPKVEVGSEQEQLLEPVAEVVSSLPPELEQLVNRIDADGRDSITLHLKGGRTVFWGSEDDSDLKAKVIAVLLKQDGTRFDVSAPGSPAVR
jgi:cell division protein FtsQ